MTRGLKIFLLSFALSLPFWLGVNVFQKQVENFFYLTEVRKSSQSVLFAQITASYAQPLPNQLSAEPVSLENVQEAVINLDEAILAKSAISVELDQEGNEKVSFERRASEKMPLASLTKLMTAVVAVEFYDIHLKTKTSQEAINQPELTGFLKLGEILSVEDLLYIMLLESSNDAAYALADIVGIEGFTHLMNLKASVIGLNNTYFFNPTGIDPDMDPEHITLGANYSTAQDLVKLTKYILLKHPGLVEILSLEEYELYLDNGILHHKIENTNELLGEIPEIVAGKTGYTETAGGCLVLVVKGKKPRSYLINAILNSPDRFEDMRKLLAAYIVY